MRLLVLLAMLVPALARGETGDEQPPKNLQILTGKTRREVNTIMKSFTQGLGVKCSFCHEKDFSSDTKPEKKTAREMMKMLADLNEHYPTLEKKGSCFMCHRGNKEVAFQP